MSILFTGTLNETATRAPPIGDNNKGVRNATPMIPNRCHAVTMIRIDLLNFFGFLLNENLLFNLLICLRDKKGLNTNNRKL